ncbi:MAG TPA: hypothetical protein VG982_02760 [Candidatus Paceibacterota bacterium]|nr:hypothetical protein [Candidatus Paceibacterota bacterium]
MQKQQELFERIKSIEEAKQVRSATYIVLTAIAMLLIYLSNTKDKTFLVLGVLTMGLSYLARYFPNENTRLAKKMLQKEELTSWSEFYKRKL